LRLGSLRKAYEDVVFAEYDAASEKELEQQASISPPRPARGLSTPSHPRDEQGLWKRCFYVCIESQRKKIKICEAKAKKDKGSASMEALAAATASLQQLLQDGVAFYTAFIDRLVHTFGLTESGTESSVRGMQSWHRSLVFLGDLTRYKEMHSERRRKDWKECTEYYTAATRLIPGIGSAHNQLAIVATLQKDELLALLYYNKALAARQSFTKARENIELLFKKNWKEHRNEAFNLVVLPDPETRGGDQKANEWATTLKRLFILTHAALYDTSRFGFFADDSQKLLHFVKALVLHGKLTPSHVLRLFLVNMATVNVAMSEETQGMTFSEKGLHSAVVSGSINLSMDMMAAVVESSQDYLAPPTSDKRERIAAMWGPCEIFLRWLTSQRELMAPENMGNKDDSIRKLLENLTILLHTVRNTLAGGTSHAIEASHADEETAVLEEDLLAAGFTPVESLGVASRLEPLGDCRVGAESLLRARRICSHGIALEWPPAIDARFPRETADLLAALDEAASGIYPKSPPKFDSDDPNRQGTFSLAASGGSGALLSEPAGGSSALIFESQDQYGPLTAGTGEAEATPPPDDFQSSDEDDEILYQPSMDIQCRKRSAGQILPGPEPPTVSQSAPIETRNPFVQKGTSVARLSKGPELLGGFSSRRRSMEGGPLVGGATQGSPAPPFGARMPVDPPRFLSNSLSPLQPVAAEGSFGAIGPASGGGIWGAGPAGDGVASWGTTNNPFCVGNAPGFGGAGAAQSGFGSVSPPGTDRFNLG